MSSSGRPSTEATISSQIEAFRTVPPEVGVTMFDAAENTRLVDAYAILSAQALTCINRLEIALPSGSEVVDDHEHLVELLVRGDRDAVLAAVSDHLNVAASHLTAPPRAVADDRSS